jgi:hypothetical protein
MTKTERLAAGCFCYHLRSHHGPQLDPCDLPSDPRDLEWGKALPLGGGSPAMYWYGFVFTSALGALVVTALAALIPDKLLARLPWRSLTWIVPLLVVIYIGYVLFPYATKT